MKRVLVCGGRSYTNADMLAVVLNEWHRKCGGFSVLIEGQAEGADTLARLWAEKYGVHVLPFPARWEEHGRAAGPIRNKQMLDEGQPDLVIAFPGGRGTANMCKQAKAAGVTVIEVTTLD